MIQKIEMKTEYFPIFICLTSLAAIVLLVGCNKSSNLQTDDSESIEPGSTSQDDTSVNDTDSNWEDTDNPPVDSDTEPFVNPIDFVRIEAGSFLWGTPEDSTEPCRAADAEDQAAVRLTHPFYLAESETTQAQWTALGFPNPGIPKGPDYPVNWVNWFEAAAFCNALSEKENLEPCYNLNCVGNMGTGCPESTDTEHVWCGELWGNSDSTVLFCAVPTRKYEKMYECQGYRLPTDAEWEYAARAGTTTATYNGDITTDSGACEEDSVMEPIGWYCNNTTHAMPVMQKQPNQWELYDMLGNVREWVDHVDTGWGLAHDEGAAEPLIDPMGIAEPAWEDWNMRTMRGGFYTYEACRARASSHFGETASGRMPVAGFRIARTIFE